MYWNSRYHAFRLKYCPIPIIQIYIAWIGDALKIKGTKEFHYFTSILVCYNYMILSFAQCSYIHRFAPWYFSVFCCLYFSNEDLHNFIPMLECKSWPQREELNDVITLIWRYRKQWFKCVKMMSLCIRALLSILFIIKRSLWDFHN